MSRWRARGSEGLGVSRVFRSCVQLAAKVRDWVVKYPIANWTPGEGGGVTRRGMVIKPIQPKKIMSRRMRAAKVLHYKRN